MTSYNRQGMLHISLVIEYAIRRRRVSYMITIVDALNGTYEIVYDMYVNYHHV